MNKPSDEDRLAEQEFTSEANWFVGKQVFRRRPKTASQIVGQIMARKGFNQQESLEQIREIWESSLDQRLKGTSLATGIRRGVLVVVVRNAMVHQELAFSKIELLEAIKKSPIGNRVKDIRFKVGVF